MPCTTILFICSITFHLHNSPISYYARIPDEGTKTSTTNWWTLYPGSLVTKATSDISLLFCCSLEHYATLNITQYMSPSGVLKTKFLRCFSL